MTTITEQIQQMLADCSECDRQIEEATQRKASILQQLDAVKALVLGVRTSSVHQDVQLPYVCSDRTAEAVADKWLSDRRHHGLFVRSTSLDVTGPCVGCGVTVTLLVPDGVDFGISAIRCPECQAKHAQELADLADEDPAAEVEAVFTDAPGFTTMEGRRETTVYVAGLAAAKPGARLRSHETKRHERQKTILALLQDGKARNAQEIHDVVDRKLSMWTIYDDLRSLEARGMIECRARKYQVTDAGRVATDIPEAVKLSSDQRAAAILKVLDGGVTLFPSIIHDRALPNVSRHTVRADLRALVRTGALQETSDGYRVAVKEVAPVPEQPPAAKPEPKRATVEQVEYEVVWSGQPNDKSLSSNLLGSSLGRVVDDRSAAKF